MIPIKTLIHSGHFETDKKPVISDVQDELDALGNEGWELVAVQDTNMPDGRMYTVAYLKRQSRRA